MRVELHAEHAEGHGLKLHAEGHGLQLHAEGPGNGPPPWGTVFCSTLKSWEVVPHLGGCFL